MKKIRFLGAVALLVVSAQGCSSESVGDAASHLNPFPTLPNFALYAQQSITLGGNGAVSGGDIGVATATVSTFGPQLIVGSGTHVDHTVIAPSVQLKAGAHVGDIETTTLTNAGGTYGTLTAFPATMPPIPLGLRSHGGMNITVNPSQQVTITPGDYGMVNVGQSGELLLNPGGTYTFTGVTLANGGKFIAAGAGSHVNVSGTLTAGQGAIVAAQTNHASDLVMTISGNDVGSTPAAGFQSASRVTALFAVPRGTLSFADHATLIGAFSAFTITTGLSTHVIYQTGLSNSPVGSQPITYANAGASAPVVGVVPASQQVAVTISLPVQNLGGLTAQLAQVTDTTNVQYRQFISTSTFAAMYGTPPLAYQNLVTWATGNNLTTNTFANLIVLDVVGAASDIEATFFVNLLTGTRTDGSQFYGPDRPPSVTTSVTLLAVQGLDNFVLPKALGSGGKGPGGTFISPDYHSIYLGCTTLNGAGQVVGIFEVNNAV